MSAPAPRPMTFDAFVAWAREQPRRYELLNGVPVAMAPERIGHVRMKSRVWRALSEALSAAGLEYEAFMDGVTVRVDDRTAYEPDVSVRCGPRLSDDRVVVPDPVIVVEVLSPSTTSTDAGAKLDGYFRIPSVQHYLLVKTDDQRVIHHARATDGTITTRIVAEGRVALDPPGIVFDLASLQ